MNSNTAKEVFLEYVSKYDTKDSRVLYNAMHSLRVGEICITIADSLFMNKDEKEIVYIGGLLHDIGSFEELKNNTNHIDYALKVLFDNKLIHKITNNRSYDLKIKAMIVEHNKLTIEGDYDEQLIKYINIVRDADKIDKLYTSTIRKFNIDDYNINPKVFEAFKSFNCVKKEDVITKVDALIYNLGFIYDIKYKYSLFYIENNKYIDKIINGYKNQSKELDIILDKIYEILTSYIKRRMSDYNAI